MALPVRDSVAASRSPGSDGVIVYRCSTPPVRAAITAVHGYLPPDLLKVVVKDGLAVCVEPNCDMADTHPAGGKVCVRAYGLVQKVYNPARIQTPLRRTNPKKARGEDPGWEPVSWDEALGLLAGKLNGIRAAGLTDASGYPRLAVTFGSGGIETELDNLRRKIDAGARIARVEAGAIWIDVTGRLRDGVTVQQATRDISALAQRIHQGIRRRIRRQLLSKGHAGLASNRTGSRGQTAHRQHRRRGQRSPQGIDGRSR